MYEPRGKKRRPSRWGGRLIYSTTEARRFCRTGDCVSFVVVVGLSAFGLFGQEPDECFVPFIRVADVAAVRGAGDDVQFAAGQGRVGPFT